MRPVPRRILGLLGTDTSNLERTMLRLFGEELRAESAYRSALAAMSTSSALGQASP